MAHKENGIDLDIRFRNNNTEPRTNKDYVKVSGRPDVRDLYELDPFEPSEEEEERSTPEGYSPIRVQCVAYGGAAVLFIFGYNVPGLYPLPWPLIGNLLPDSWVNLYPEVTVTLLGMWGIYFTKRFAEVLFVHIYSSRMDTGKALSIPIYFCVFGLWIGWANNFHLGYRTPYPAFYYIGILLFIIGVLGNGYCHLKLRQLRVPKRQLGFSSDAQTQTTPTRYIPTGRFFDSVSCPHYSFELVTWLGFSLTSFTAAAFFLLLTSACILFLKASQQHEEYLQEFDGRERRELYPTHRKALIPFIF